jgi:hypothetical protein
LPEKTDVQKDDIATSCSQTGRGWLTLRKMSRNNGLESDFESNDQADIREHVVLDASLVSSVFIGHR